MQNLFYDQSGLSKFHIVKGRPQIHLYVEGKEKPIHLIWDLLHQFGRFLLEFSKIKDFKIDKEEMAWNIAFEIFILQDELLLLVKDFKHYKDKAIETHRKLYLLKMNFFQNLI